MINIGTDSIEKIYLGTDEILRVYSGTELIYGLDPNVVNYITATGETDVTFINALNTLVVYLKINNIYSKLQAWWIFYGNFVKSKNNVINPSIDLLNFVGGGSLDNNGFQGDGTVYADTGFVPVDRQSINNNGITLISGTNNTTLSEDVVDIGAYNSGTQISALIVKGNSTNRRNGVLNQNPTAAVDFTNEARGIFTVTKQLVDFHKTFRNGTIISTGGGGGNLPEFSFYILALNLLGNPYGPSNQRIQQTIIHEGLSDSEVGILHTGLDIFENTLGRKTW